MALPRSTYVMGVVTLGLFGVAIYETAGKKGHDRRQVEDDGDSYDGDEPPPDDDEAIADYQRAEAERARRDAEEAAHQARKREAKKAELKQLYDAEVAMPGALFAGLPLDSTQPPGEAFEQRRRDFITATLSSVRMGDDGRFHRLEIRPGSGGDHATRDELCGELDTLLDTAWGSATVEDSGIELWTNKLTGNRASFDPRGECTLVFDKYDEPAAWINKSSTSTIPISWIGKPAAFVEKAVGSNREGDEIFWVAHGPGAGTEPTRITAWVANGKIKHFSATTAVSVPTRDALEAHLRAEFGKPAAEARTSRDLRLDWPARKLVVVLDDNGTIALMVGDP